MGKEKDQPIERPFSFTQLDTLLRCGEKYRRIYADDPPQKNIVGYKAVFGRSWHGAMQAIYMKVMERRDGGQDRLSPEELAEVGWRAFDYGFRRGVEDPFVKQMKNDPEPDELAGKASRMIEAFCEQEVYRFDPGYVEEKVTFELPNGRRVVGYLDLVTTDGYIVDFKSKFKRMNVNEAHKSRQLSIYTLGYYAKFEKLPVGVGLMWCGWGRDKDVKGGPGKPQFEWLESSRGPGNFKRLRNAMQEALDLIEVGTFLPPPQDSFVCTNECQFWKTCPVRP
ncbi:MAG: PD-(D/E)XK nuclease family protein [Dehalococcoidales bacterium]